MLFRSKIVTFNNLTKKVLKAATEFSKLEYKVPIEYDVKACWANTLTEKDYIQPHNHFTSDLCATYFLTAPENSSPLHFIEADEYIKPEQDLLIIYYPHMMHGSPSMHVNEKRITVNYNLKIKSEFIYSILP